MGKPTVDKFKTVGLSEVKVRIHMKGYKDCEYYGYEHRWSPWQNRWKDDNCHLVRMCWDCRVNQHKTVGI